MRIKLTLTQDKPKQLIPSDYHYAITSFIYRTIERSDAVYSEWLHSKGFSDDSKRFKFFNFSDFLIPDRNFNIQGKIEIISSNFNLYISMLSDKSIEHLIIGMFDSGKMKIFDNTTEACFSVKYIETVPEPEYKQTMRYRILTPAVFSKKVLYNGKESPHYLRPDEEDYKIYFLKNIAEKYKIYTSGNADYDSLKMDFKIAGDFKKHIRTIKVKGSPENKVAGYKYDFVLDAPPEVHKLIRMSGVGIKNSFGFGFVNS